MPSRPEWFRGWEQQGIDMHTIPEAAYHWFDVEILRAFTRYGTRRFWLDDIWRFQYPIVKISIIFHVKLR